MKGLRKSLIIFVFIQVLTERNRIYFNNDIITIIVVKYISGHDNKEIRI